MAYFARLNPLRAIRDLRLFLHHRQKHELAFLALSIVLTGLLIIGFAKDSSVEKEYHPDIIYVQQWRLDRTEAQIRAQQAIDAPIKARELAEQKKRQDELQASFKRMDDKLKSWGM